MIRRPLPLPPTQSRSSIETAPAEHVAGESPRLARSVRTGIAVVSRLGLNNSFVATDIVDAAAAVAAPSAVNCMAPGAL